MRYMLVLLGALGMLGCGAGNGRPPGGATFTSTVPTMPAIIALSPVSVPVNSVAFTMIINGSGFGPDAVVFWNGVAQQTRVITANQLMVAITAQDLQGSGLVRIFVRSGGFNSNTVNFQLTFP